MQDEWVVCRVIHRNTTTIVKPSSMLDLTRMNSFVESLLDSPSSLPPLIDSPFPEEKPNALNFTNIINGTSSSNVQHYIGTSLPHYPKMTAMSSDGNTFYYHNPQMQPQNYNPTNYQMPNSVVYSQNPYLLHQKRLDNSIPNYPGSDRLKQFTNQVPEWQCKIEQFSTNQSMVSQSQDTGLSTDITTDISSAKQEENTGNILRNFDDTEDHSVICPLSDLDSFWNY